MVNTFLECSGSILFGVFENHAWQGLRSHILKTRYPKNFIVKMLPLFMSDNIYYMQLNEINLYFCYNICDVTMMHSWLCFPFLQDMSVSLSESIQLPEQFQFPPAQSYWERLGRKIRLQRGVASSVCSQISTVNATFDSMTIFADLTWITFFKP